MQTPSIYLLFRDDRLKQWRDQLSTVLGLEVAALERMEVTYYDSFDWRLYAAGKRLECVRLPERVELRLVRLADQAVEAMLPYEVGDARFPSELPDSELKQRLQDLLEMRAYLPLAMLKVRRYSLRQVDSEAKTRARLHLESFTLVTADGKRRLLQKRLRLQPLRGYAKTARTLGRILEDRFRLQAVEDELFMQTLTASGKHPGGYSSKLEIELQPGIRADAAVREVLLKLFDAMQANEAGTIADLDSEFLHDFRVAVRRTRSALGELKKVFAPATLQRFRSEFAWLGSLTSNVRDLDVYLLKFDSYKAAIPAELRDDLEPLRSFLKYKQHMEQSQQLAVQLQGKRYRKLKQQWERYLHSPLAKRPIARDAGKTISEVAGHRTWHMYRRVIKEGKAITAESPAPELHELRKSCKKLRYLMEFFQSLYPPGAIRASIKELKQLQDNLGDFQDLDVQIGALKGFAMEMRRRGEYNAATGKAMDALLEALDARMHAARAEFESRFEQFSCKDNQARFAQLFHSDEAVNAA
jgi:CHAD domain-containing protein